MRIIVNGDEREVRDGALLAELMPDNLSGTAVAVNDEIVPRTHISATALAAADRVEVVTAVQGG